MASQYGAGQSWEPNSFHTLPRQKSGLSQNSQSSKAAALESDNSSMVLTAAMGSACQEQGSTAMLLMLQNCLTRRLQEHLGAQVACQGKELGCSDLGVQYSTISMQPVYVRKREKGLSCHIQEGYIRVLQRNRTNKRTHMDI